MRTIRTTLFIALIAISCTNSKDIHKNSAYSFEKRAAHLVSLMTLDEKVSQMRHDSPAINRLEIPEHNWWNEGLHGVARSGLATVFPQAIGMGAMWDRNQMSSISEAISDEARAKYNEFSKRGKRGIYQGLSYWTPNINIFRDPRWGRGMETYGEDPYLTGELGVRFIKGLQGNDPTYYKLIATAKHFVVHSGPESERHKFDAQPSIADMINTYQPQFKKAVKDGKVYSIMCAYNSYHGVPCCGNKKLTNLLRMRWGFKGYVVSDCWAIVDFFDKNAHAIVKTPEEAGAMAVKAGTDLNCGSTYKQLANAVKQGLISEKEIDISVERLMVARLKLGLFAPKDDIIYDTIPYSVVDSELHRLLALESAQKSIVLLKNDQKTLPLSKEIKKIAIIGPNANDLDVLLGNYNGYPSDPKTPLQGIREKLPNAEIKYAIGTPLAIGLPILSPIPSDVLYTDISLTKHGLVGQYFDSLYCKGRCIETRVDTNIDFTWKTTPPINELKYDLFSTRWSGYLVVNADGLYALGGEAFSGIKLFLNDSLLLTREDIHHPRKEYEYVDLKANKPYKLTVEYNQNNTEYSIIRLLWDTPNRKLEEEAIKICSESEVIIACMGISPLLEGEEMKVKIEGFLGGDRIHINLPSNQTDLLKKLKKLGKPIVLVLLNGSALAINWETENIPAIIEAWYPGQAGGSAIADIIFGDYNPAGRLPLTFYSSIGDIPEFNNYSMQGKTYRYFKGKPLYEFGHGLSYSSFEYTSLIVPEQINTGEDLIVSVNVKNTSSTDGDEVVQIYANSTHSGGINPNISLVGFERIFLKSGESKSLRFTITPEQLAIVDETNMQVNLKGKLFIYAGGSMPSNMKTTSKGVAAEVDIIGDEYIIK